MPAIQPARLKIQILELAEKFSRPDEFRVALNDLFFYYADRTRKSGRSRSTYTLINSYNVPRQVMRQTERLLYPQVSAQPEMALSLADVLWKEKWLECRQLALIILGWIPPNPPERIIQRVRAWAQGCKEDRGLQEALVKGLARLRLEHTELFFHLLESWLKSPDQADRLLGLRVIPPLVREPDFQHLPRVFNLLSPIIQRVGVVPAPDILRVVRVIAEESPQETAYFLHKSLAVSENTGVFVLIRQSLDAFPPQIRNELKVFLHQRREEFRGQ